MAQAHSRWIPKSSNTRSEYVMLISLPRQQGLHERASVLRYTFTVCFVMTYRTLLIQYPSYHNANTKTSTLQVWPSFTAFRRQYGWCKLSNSPLTIMPTQRHLRFKYCHHLLHFAVNMGAVNYQTAYRYSKIKNELSNEP